MTTLSVIIPAYRPHSFDALARSMAANADVDAEWIVVDDASGPDYDEIFASLPDGVRLLRQAENGLQAAARNAGLAQARGHWIKFLDADDALDEGHLSALLAVATQDKAIPFAPTKHVLSNGTTHVNVSWRNLSRDSMEQYTQLLVRPFLHHCGALFPREILMHLGGYDESLITDEDGDLLLRVLREGYHFIPVEGVYYLYVHHESGPRVSADDDIDKMQARIQVCRKAAEDFDGHMPTEVAKALAQRMDKIAMAYWTAFPEKAEALVVCARAIAPEYVPDMRRPLRLLRRVCGPSVVFTVQKFYRHLKGLPKGGAQG